MIKVSSSCYMNTFALAFSASNIGPKKFQSILNHFENLEKAWAADEYEYEKIGIIQKTYRTFDEFRKKFEKEKYEKELLEKRVTFISVLDKKYPKVLKKLESPPIGLFIKGNGELLSEKLLIGVVGTRKITSYGRTATENIVSGLVENGVVIVSGLALGVDGTAHRTAVAKKGKTIAVLACGVDCCRPSEHYSLYQDILKNDGLILSEYPLSLSPQKGTFLARNRIIAALSDGVLVTEAASDSGSLVTAEWGLKLNKKIFAVPGPITSRMSDGSLKLLKQGAKLVTDGNDVLKEFNISGIKGEILKLKNLTSAEGKIIEYLQNEPMSIDEISKKISLPISKLFTIISRLELNGMVINDAGKLRIK